MPDTFLYSIKNLKVCHGRPRPCFQEYLPVYSENLFYTPFIIFLIMKTIAKMCWLTEDQLMDVHSPDEAAAKIADLDTSCREKPMAVQITRPDLEVMMIIIGHDRFVCSWWPAGYKGTGSHHTVAEDFDPDVDKLPQNPEVLTYYLFGHHGEVPVQYAISKEAAILAVREFLMSPGLPRCLRWEMD